MNDKEIKETIAKIYSDGFSHGCAAALEAAVGAVDIFLRLQPEATGIAVLKVLGDLKVPK